MASAEHGSAQPGRAEDIRLLVDTIPVSVWLSRPDGSAEFFNQRWLEYTGLPREQALDWGWKVAIHPEDLPRMLETFQEALNLRRSFEVEGRFRRWDGEFRWFLFRGTPLLDGSGDVVKWYGTNTDLEDRKRAEEKLRRSEADLLEAQRISQTGSWKLDVSSGTVTGSPQMLRIYGVKPDEDTSNFELWFGRTHPEDRKRMLDLFERSKIQKTDYDADYRIVLPDGAVKHIHTNGHPVLNDSGDVVEFVGTNMEITERKHAEEALWRSEGYLADARRLAHIGVWARNVGSGNSVYRSQEIYRLFGFDPESGLPSDQAFYSRIHPEDRDRATIMAFHERTPKGADFDLEFRVVLPDGGIKYIRSAGRPVRNMSGEVTEYVGISMDVTERKRAEDERERLRQLEADLAHRNRLTMLGVLASSLAHELNQPIAAAMTSANACLQWLAHNPPNLERARAAAMRIENDGSRAAQIIQRLRAFYKTGRPPQRELVDLNEVAGEMLALLRNEATRHSISLHTDLAPQLPGVTADRVQLQQVLMNLMLNGIEAMKDAEGELTIRSRRTEDGLLISVNDTGVGLPSEKLDQIFNAFYTTKPQGTGMGLAISRSIIEAHGGRLWATANAKRGATFHFTLPAELQQ